MREAGYYWVKASEESDWEVDFYNGETWEELEHIKAYSWKPFDKWIIGPKIEEPEE